jgi:sulfatase maturation enzyme AslB (radical SAM superfamily)
MSHTQPGDRVRIRPIRQTLIAQCPSLLAYGCSAGTVYIPTAIEWRCVRDSIRYLADGWNSIPFRAFIAKVHSWCDLSCDYCYMYEMADQSWRDQPRRMSAEIAEWTTRRIGEHAQAHGSAEVAVSCMAEGRSSPAANSLLG